MALPVLYEIAKDYKDALEELTDIEDEAVVDTLEGLKGTLETKSENIIKYTQTLNGTIQAIYECSKPIISAIEGGAAGAGVSLAMA